jgi:hypothetical protein
VTPEGKVKRAINKALEKWKGTYVFMPVPGGYGPSSLDYLLCYHGRFIAIEAKAPGKKPSPRQRFIIKKIEEAGGITLVIDDEKKAGDLIAFTLSSIPDPEYDY